MRTVAAALIAGWGCAGDGSATDSSAPVRSEETAWVANPYDDSVARVDRGNGTVQEVAVGAEPSRVVLLGDRVLVTLRVGSELVELSNGPVPAVVRVVPVGSGPVGIVADPAADCVYVALSGEDAVVELCGKALDVGRRWDVEDQPTWLGIHPEGKALYIASAMSGRLSWIDLSSDTSLAVAVSIPEMENVHGTTLSLRLTGDPAVNDSGRLLAVPLLYIDSTSGVGVDGYAESGSRLRPAVGVLEIAADGVPTYGATVLGILAAHTTELGVKQPDLRSYLSGVAFGADGRTVLAAMEGSNVTVALDVGAVGDAPVFAAAGAEGSNPEPDTDDVDEQVPVVPAAAFWVSGGPHTITRDEAGDYLVYAVQARELYLLPHEAVAAAIAESEGASTTPIREDRASRLAQTSSVDTDAGVEFGRGLFYTATDARVAQPGSGISCATCHFMGATDGLTWLFKIGYRQTPSLAGGIEDTVPFTWSGTITRVEHEVALTIDDRMGGSGLTDAEAGSVADWIQTIRRVAPSTTLSTDAVARGKAAFHARGCAGCHVPGTYTDGLVHWVNGDYFETPSLRRLAVTAPYYDDGLAPTLSDALRLAPEVGMSGPLDASSDEFADLETFLRSL